MSVNATQSSTAVAATASPSAAISQTQDRFLQLLIAQLQNQDPMNPMENAEMTTQLAQMSTVEGINNLNANMETLMSSLQSAQGLQAASMIGRSVMVEGEELVSDGAGAQGGVALDGKVDALAVTVRDAFGNAVDTLDLGPQAAGFVRFEWDGLDASGNPLAAGEYRFEVKATLEGESVDATGYMTGLVNGVYMSDAGVSLDVEGKGSFAFSEVKQIL